MELKPIFDVASSISNNLIMTAIFAIFVLFFYTKCHLKLARDKNMELKIISIFVTFMVVLLFNYVIILLSISFISKFDKIIDTDTLNLIFSCIMIFANFIFMSLYYKVYLAMKKKWIDFKYADMPMISVCIYWTIGLLFIICEIDLKYLFEGIGYHILGYLFMLFAFIIPTIRTVFNVENYKIIIYMKGFKIPIRLQENTELVKQDDTYIIIYYSKDKAKIIRKDTISEDEVSKIIENYKI